MKVRMLLKRNYTKQYSEDGFGMEAECKTIDIDLPDITNEDAKRNNFVGEWQIVGYEEIEDEWRKEK